MKRKEERCVRFVITVVTIQRHLVFYSDHIVGIGIALQWHCIKITTRSFISQLRGHLPIAIAILLNIDEKMLSSAYYRNVTCTRPIWPNHLANVYKADQNLNVQNHLWVSWLSDDSDWPYTVQIHEEHICNFECTLLHKGLFLVQYQRGVSLMLNIWCFCKTFVRPSTRDCQQQPCFLTQIPTRHQIISAGGAFFFHS